MKTLKILFVFALIKLVSSPMGGGWGGYLFAQQDPLVNQYMLNGLFLNPAYAGARKTSTLTGTYRKQWTAFEGAPVTQSLSYDQKIGSKMGGGLIFINDQTGVTRQTDFFGDYSYYLKLSKRILLSFGLRAGVSSYRADLTSLNVWDENDASFSHDITGKWIPNFGTGAFLHGRKYYAGISVPRMLSYDPAKFLHVLMDRSPRYERHYYLTGGYEFGITEIFTLKPSLLFKFVPAAPAQIDLNLLGYYRNLFAIGISYRTKNSVVALLEFNTKKRVKIGYSFDYSFSKLAQYFSGSHEIMISYDLKKGISKAQID